jgi:uncharacterized protein (TIGR03067 family)
MRLLTLLLLLTFSIGCTTTKKTSTASNLLNGNWIPIKEEMGGMSLPTSVFANQKMTLLDSTYTVIAESVDKGIVKYKGNKMDIYGKDGVNAGKHFTAIYKYENKQLTVCYNLAGDGYPETFETKGKQMYFLSVFIKETKK